MSSLETLEILKALKETTFFNELVRGNMFLVEQFLKFYDVSINDYVNNITPLGHAIIKNKTKICKLLIENGADVNCACNKEKISIYEKDSNSLMTPLAIASNYGYKPIIKLLLEKGADVNKGDFNNATPLLHSFYQSDKTVVELLLENGADISCVTISNNTALMSACYNNYDMDIIKRVFKEQFVNLCNKNSETPLTNTKCPKIIKYLLENGAEVNTLNNKGISSLMRAVSDNKYENVKLLLEYGANPLLNNDTGKNSLQIARDGGFTDIVKLLETCSEFKDWESVNSTSPVDKKND